MTAQKDFYREQAIACAEAADRAELANQREKFLGAQRAWEALAHDTAKVEAQREARLAAAELRLQVDAEAV